MGESEELGHCPEGHSFDPRHIPHEIPLTEAVLASPIATSYGDFVEYSIEGIDNFENEVAVAEDEENATEIGDGIERNAAAEEKDPVDEANNGENAMAVAENDEKTKEKGESVEKDAAGDEKNAVFEEKATEKGDSIEKDAAGVESNAVEEEKIALVEGKNGQQAMDEDTNEENAKQEKKDYEAVIIEQEDENEEKTRKKLKNEEKVEATSKGKEKKLGLRRIRKKLEQRVSKKVIVTDKHKPESSASKEAGKKNKQIAVQEVRNGQHVKDEEEEKEENSKQEEEENNEAAVIEGEEEGEENRKRKEKIKEKAEGTSVGRAIRSRTKSRRKKVEQKGSKKVTIEDRHKPYLSDRKRAESMGMIFMCSSKTKEDCYRYNVLGLPANKRDIVLKVYKGMRLFLFDFDLKLLYGIYKATGPGGYNIEPKAFKSAFPSQVRFKILEDCLPLAEDRFRKVIKDNYYTRTKFDCQLNAEQVKKLCKLFVAANRGSKSTKSIRSLRAEGHTAVAQDRIMRHGVDEGEHTYAEPDRIKRLAVDDITHMTVERDRIRWRFLDDDYRRSVLSGERRYKHPAMYEREAFASTLVPTLPPQAPAPSYAYQRVMDIDAYRRDLAQGHPYLQIMDMGTGRRDEIGRQDLYLSYRQPASYRDTFYSPSLPAEYHLSTGLPPENRSTGLLTDYRSSAQPEPNYPRHV